MKRELFSGFLVISLLISMSGLASNTRSGKADGGTIYIRADGSIDPPTAPIYTADSIMYALTGNITSDADGIVIERDNIVLDGAGCTVKGTVVYPATGIVVSERSNVTIKGFKIDTFHFGIMFHASNGSRIIANNLAGNINGIFLQEVSSNNSVSGNILRDNEVGMYLFNSYYNTIVENTLTKCTASGIFLVGWANNNNMSTNIITDNLEGISIRDSYYNFASANRIADNTRGIQLSNYAESNTFSHNNIVDNTQQTYVENTCLLNAWDNGYPSAGNYWSDHYSVDVKSGPYQNETRSDGIGDQPYTVTVSVQDRFPLEHAWNTSFSEMDIVTSVNGTRAYDYDLDLEDITSIHYAFRSGGSIGANETANRIKQRFESCGIEAWLEPFTFTTWELLAKPFLSTDDDGNPATISDQTNITSFQSLHFSYPTPSQGIFADLVILPLPNATDKNDLSNKQVNLTEWNAIDTTGKILLIGQEVSWCQGGSQAFNNKINAQPPAAIIRTWWFDWMSFAPDWFGSSSGRPLGNPMFWNLHIPIGFVNHEDGQWIGNQENTLNISSKISIRSLISSGTHYNVVGRIKGNEDPQKLLIISAHYDSVTCNGFGDNGAGTAGVLELAKVFSEAVKEGIYKPAYTLLFIAFTDEELGLVGSAQYIKQHKDQMPNVTAVINLDCIGSDDLYVSETDPSNGFDLDEEIMKAASDLGIPAATTSPGGSDQETFREPMSMNDAINYYWGIDLDIADASPVNSSALIISFPLFYYDEWTTGTPGWIHTSYDNSTSTQTLNWIEAEDLERQIKVSALTAVRISPDTQRLGNFTVDAALLEVSPLKTVVGKGYSMNTNITVMNQGNCILLITVAEYANSTTIYPLSEELLSKGDSQTVVSVWDTTDFVYGNYTLSAYAWPVPEEVDVADNNCTCSVPVHVGVPGDISGPTRGVYDGTTNMRDINYLILLFNTCPSSPNWKSNADVNNDGTVNMRDIQIAILNFNKHE